jgi:hypothetical protein
LAHPDCSACVDEQHLIGSLIYETCHNDNFLNLIFAANIRQIFGKSKNKCIFALRKQRYTNVLLWAL